MPRCTDPANQAKVSEFRTVAYPDRTAFYGDYFRVGGYSAT
jgi:hypothetical protein